MKLLATSPKLGQPLRHRKGIGIVYGSLEIAVAMLIVLFVVYNFSHLPIPWYETFCIIIIIALLLLSL